MNQLQPFDLDMRQALTERWWITRDLWWWFHDRHFLRNTVEGILAWYIDKKVEEFKGDLEGLSKVAE